MPRSPYHEGERRAQERAGLGERMARAGAPGPSIPAAAADFLAERTWVIAAYAGFEGEPRIEVLSGPPGFVRAAGEEEIAIAAGLEISIERGASIGLLAIEPSTKRRMKAKGVVTAVDGSSPGVAGKAVEPESAQRVPGPAGGFITMKTRSVYALCPKHMTPREVEIRRGSRVQAGSRLTESQGEWVAGADTFFIGTHSREGGADASHRGGAPGFVRVIDANTIEFPDYSGNNMFNTIGNLEMDPRIAVLFIDFESGRELTLEGRAEVRWMEDEGAGRTIAIVIQKITERW